ncbi:MAG TPA: DUF6036 family nucleotidyltransferase [Terriglobales bacterium]
MAPVDGLASRAIAVSTVSDPVANDPIELPKPWSDFLKEADSALSQPVSLTCIGGFVLTALYGLPRPTGDIDYIEVQPREAANEIDEVGGPNSALAKKYRVCFQNVGIAYWPDQYESRIEELKLNLRKLKLWVLEPYDLLLSKVPRNSPKDREDAKYLIRKLNLEFATFNGRWEKEMAPRIGNRERHTLTVDLWKEYFPK